MNEKTKSKTKLIFTLLLIIVILPIFFNFKDRYDSEQNLSSKELPSLSNGAYESGGGYTLSVSNLTTWFEISTTGINMSISDEDDDYEVIDFESEGWNFTFYEKEYSKLFVTSNGWMSFSNISLTNYHINEIPDTDIKNKDSIAIFGTDINLNAGGDVFYLFNNLSPTKYLVVEYHQPVTYEEEELIGDFEVILFENGSIIFQYKTISNISYLPTPRIGLDHGDLLNYNKYTNFISLNETVFEFNFYEMASYNCSVEIGEEIEWIITELNESKMQSWLGSEWFSKLGLPINPEYTRKFKVNLTSITENATDFQINLSTWGWEYRLDSYNKFPEFNHSLIFKQDPFAYNQQVNLTHIFPKILPSPAYYYLFNTKLTSYYSLKGPTSKYGEALLDYDTGFIFNGSTIIMIEGSAKYNSRGILERMDFTWTNFNSSEEEDFFTLELMSNEYLTNFSLGIEEGDKLEWIVNRINSSVVESLLGSNWEEMFGLPSNPQKWDKMMLNFSQIQRNQTDWDIKYSIWDWIGEKDIFGITPQDYDHLILPIDPLNGTNHTNLTNIFPFIVPNPTNIYCDFMDLGDKYSVLPMVANDTWVSYFIELNSTLLRIDGRYNHLGILSYFSINNISTTSSFLMSLFEGEALFSMVNIVEGTIPDYVGVEENQYYEYGVYYSEEKANELGLGIIGANNYTKR
ncbi:MAG: hypothetical protein EU521_01880, partial [Promethearchaeota archaeon]